LKLAEPTTSITDFLLAAELFAFSFLTFHAETHHWCVELWAAALATLGISALTGGIFHGCAPYLSPSKLTQLWRITIMMVIATLGFMIAAGFVSSFSKYPTEILLLVTELPVLYFIIRAARQPAPQMLVKHSKRKIAIAILVMALLYVRQIYAGGAESGEWILIGSMISLAGIWVQQTDFKLHKHFNQNDLCHLFFMVGVYFLYRGGFLLRDH
jgi:hypothetical protein